MTYPDNDAGVTTVAKDQAAQVGRSAADAGGTVAQTTKEQAQQVVGEAKQQARDLVGEARTQVSDQASTQKGRAVEGLRAIGGELEDMTGGEGSGLATEVARQAAQRAHALADHLDRHEPTELLEQVRSYARRRPVMFLAGMALAGVVAGRLTRNLADTDDAPTGTNGTQGAYAPVPALPPVEPVFEPVGTLEPVASGYSSGQAGTVVGGYADPTPGYDATPGYADGTPGYADPTPGYVDPAPGFTDPTPGYVDPAYPAGNRPGETDRTP